MTGKSYPSNKVGVTRVHIKRPSPENNLEDEEYSVDPVRMIMDYGPKPKQRQLYICSEVAEACIDGLDVNKEFRAVLKHKLWNLTTKTGWVHFHTYSEFLANIQHSHYGWRNLLIQWQVLRLRHLLNRCKVERKSI